jgi:hypothetical protein
VRRLRRSLLHHHDEARLIITDGNGRPFPKPDPADFATVTEFVRAIHAYNDRVTQAANRAFEDAFAKALKAGRKAR